MIYTIKQGNKTVSVKHMNKWYTIGFPKITHARVVHYNISPEPCLTLLKSELYVPDTRAHIQSTLFISKHKGDHWHPMNDGNYHLHGMKENDFYKLACNGLGLVYAYNLKHEDEHEFTFDAHVFDPSTFADSIPL